MLDSEPCYNDSVDESGLNDEYKSSELSRDISFEDYCDLVDKYAISAMNTLISRLRYDNVDSVRAFAKQVAQASYYIANHMIRERACQMVDIRNEFANAAGDTKVWKVLVE